jgi:hypothetical protein
LTIVIAALAITAFVGSVTVPTIMPVGVCAITVTSARNRIDNRRFMARNQETEKTWPPQPGSPVEMRVVGFDAGQVSYNDFGPAWLN